MDEPKPSRIYRIAGVTFRVLAGLFMAVIVAAGLFWTWNEIQDRQLEQAVSEVRLWPEKQLPFKQPATATLRTRCRDGMLYYYVEIEPENTELSEPILKSWRGIKFTVKLYDDSGFVLMNWDVDRLSNVVDEKGTRIKMSANEKIPCSKKSLLRRKKLGDRVEVAEP